VSLLAVSLLAVSLLAVALLAAGCGSKDRPTLSADTLAPSTSTTAAPAPTDPPSHCRTVDAGQSLVATAAAEGNLEIFANPGDPAAARTLPNPRLINDDPNAKVPLTFLVADFSDTATCDWVKVYLPVRPNGSTGWVRSTDVNFAVNSYRLEVMLKEFTLKVFKDGEQTDEIKVGVAKDNTPTPGGLYYTTELIKTPNPGGAYGPYAFGLSGFSDTLTSFNGGPGQLRIHGTNEPSAIGTQVSHGCIRMSNDDITRLARMLPLGTPVQIDA
jgi:lipoprotein-anchoring transpeptidase ErfK/SrfK